ncbi:MAG: hypothetical protein ACI920_001897 [Saprospiraceae bacterium]
MSRDSDLNLRLQCRILEVSRSNLYYENQGENALNLELMGLMDEHYHYHPYQGAPRMHVWLTKDKGYKVSQNRVGRLYYKVMGLRAIISGPHTSKRHKNHAVYPYLLRELKIEKPQQIWATDITYMPSSALDKNAPNARSEYGFFSKKKYLFDMVFFKRNCHRIRMPYQMNVNWVFKITLYFMHCCQIERITRRLVNQNTVTNPSL